MLNAIEVGMRFNRWTVVRDSGRRSARQPIWECRCECGDIGFVQNQSLKNGHSRQCKACGNRDRKMAHGQTFSPEWYAWVALRSRCNNPLAAGYVQYGGRGIKVCERWNRKRIGFINFLADMGEKPSSCHTVDRIDYNGDYSPENCRWADPTQQARNKRSNRRITINDETLCLMEWAERSGVPYAVIRWRLNDGWDPERAIFQAEPPKYRNGRQNLRIEAFGVTKPVTQWAAELGLSYFTIMSRLRSGKVGENALYPVGSNDYLSNGKYPKG